MVSLNETRTAQADISKGADKQKQSEASFDQRAHSYYMKNNRLRKRMSNLHNEDAAIAMEMSEKAAELTRIHEETESTRSSHEQEILDLWAMLYSLQAAQKTLALQLEQEQATDSKTKDLLDTSSKETESLKKKLNLGQIAMQGLTRRFDHAQCEGRALTQHNRRATRKLATLERYKEQVSSTLKFIEKKAYHPCDCSTELTDVQCGRYPCIKQ